MRFTVTDEIPWPRALVFPTLRDRTLDLLPYMPNVAEIEVLDEQIEGLVKRSVKRWRGSPDEIPGPLRPLVKPELLSWIDHARWDGGAYTCEWRHEFPALPAGISARGLTRYLEEGERTVIQMAGEFTIKPEAFTFLPQLLARKLAPPMESFVIGRIKPNVTSTNAAVDTFLNDQEP